MYDDKLVEQLIMDLGSIQLELENAWRDNPEAVKKEAQRLKDIESALGVSVSKVIRGAA